MNIIEQAKELIASVGSAKDQISADIASYFSNLPGEIRTAYPDLASGAIDSVGFLTQLAALAVLPPPFNILSSAIIEIIKNGVANIHAKKLKPNEPIVEPTEESILVNRPAKDLTNPSKYFKGFDENRHVVVYGPTNVGKTTRICLYLMRGLLRLNKVPEASTYIDSYFGQKEAYYVLAPNKNDVLKDYLLAIAAKEYLEKDSLEPEIYYYNNTDDDYKKMMISIKAAENGSKKKLLIVDDIQSNKKILDNLISDIISIRSFNTQVVSMLHNYKDTKGLREQSTYVVLINVPQTQFKMIFSQYLSDNARIENMFLNYYSLANSGPIYNRVLIFDTLDNSIYLGFGRGLEFMPLLSDINADNNKI